MLEFKPFPKIPRITRECVITEKIDGTNAQIYIERLVEDNHLDNDQRIAELGDLAMYAGSRTRWITPQHDNFGFANWAQENADELFKLGEGQHFGEWWGQGIQRGYGLDHKRFSLFNTARWNKDNPNLPACCHSVPVLYTGMFGEGYPQALESLVSTGSIASPGFMKPEGIVIYHSASKQMYKKLIENDDIPKGVANEIREI